MHGVSEVNVFQGLDGMSQWLDVLCGGRMTCVRVEGLCGRHGPPYVLCGIKRLVNGLKVSFGVQRKGMIKAYLQYHACYCQVLSRYGIWQYNKFLYSLQKNFIWQLLPKCGEINFLWFGDAICWHISVLALFHAVDWWTISETHQWVISQEMYKISMLDTSLKIIDLRFKPYLPEANELNCKNISIHIFSN